jgi:hypothetical protein
MLESTRNSILSSIQNFKDQCFDLQVSSETLGAYVQDNKVEFFPYVVKDSKIEFNDKVVPDWSAEGQFLSRLKIPISFFHRCPRKIQTPILECFNIHKNFLLRCIKDEEDDTDKCRAVLTSMYTTNYDNYLIFPVILDELKDEDLIVKSFLQTDHITRLEVKFTGMEVSHKGETVEAGLMITNSETGHSAIWIEPIIVINKHYILGNRSELRGNMSYSRLIHKGEGVKPEKIAAAIKEAKEVAQVGVIQYLQAVEEEVSPRRAINFINSIAAVPKRFTNLLEEQWKDEEKIKKLTVAKELLKAAEELPILNKITIEQSTGRWLDLFGNYTQRLMNIQEDLIELQEIEND